MSLCVCVSFVWLCLVLAGRSVQHSVETCCRAFAAGFVSLGGCYFRWQSHDVQRYRFRREGGDKIENAVAGRSAKKTTGGRKQEAQEKELTTGQKEGWKGPVQGDEKRTEERKADGSEGTRRNNKQPE